MSETKFAPTYFDAGRCQICGNMRQTKYITFYRNVGMLFARRTYTIYGNLCRPCIHKRFWEIHRKKLAMVHSSRYNLWLSSSACMAFNLSARACSFSRMVFT